MSEEIISTINDFIDIVTVILPKYSTKIPEYCIDEESWLAIQKLLELYDKQKERIDYLEELLSTIEEYYSITIEDLENCIKNDK